MSLHPVIDDAARRAGVLRMSSTCSRKKNERAGK